LLTGQIDVENVIISSLARESKSDVMISKYSQNKGRSCCLTKKCEIQVGKDFLKVGCYAINIKQTIHC